MKECFGFVIIDRGWLELGRRNRPVLEDGSAIPVIRPGEVYVERRRSANARIDLVTLPPNAAPMEGTFDRVAAADPRAQTLRRLRDVLLAKDDDLGLDGAVCEAARALIARNDQQQAEVRESSAVRRARELLLDRYRENVRLDELAEYARLEKFRLVRAFRARYGVAPYEYLTHARIMQARRLLGAGLRPAEVAMEVGYCDQSQLHRHFVRIIGTTPGRYRRKGRA